MRSVIVLGTLGLAGCDLIFELNDPHTPRDVAVEIVRQHLANASDGMPALFPDPPSLDGISVRLADGTEPDLELDGVGRVAFVGYRAEQYQVTYGVGDEATTIRSGVDNPRFDATEFGRLDRTPVMPATKVVYENLDTTGIFRQRVMTSGVWATMTGPPMMTFDPLVAPWDSAIPFEGIGALVESSKNDRIYLGSYQFEAGHSPPYERLHRLSTDRLDMLDGTSNFFPTDMSQLTAVECNMVTVDLPAVEERLSGFPEFDQRSAFITAVAVPSPDTHPLRGFILASATTATIDPISVAFQYPDAGAFPGYTRVIRLDVLHERTATGPGGPVAVFLLSSHTAAVLDGSCPTNDLFATEHQVAVPTTPALDNRALSEDDTIVEIKGDRDLRLTWDKVGDRVDAYGVLLVKLEAGTGMSTSKAIRSYRTRDPRLNIEPDLLETNGTYFFVVTAVSGIPGAGDGDFAQLSLPYDFTSIASSTFRVLR